MPFAASKVRGTLTIVIPLCTSWAIACPVVVWDPSGYVMLAWIWRVLPFWELSMLTLVCTCSAAGLTVSLSAPFFVGPLFPYGSPDCHDGVMICQEPIGAVLGILKDAT